jgi:hypothetical protein
MSVSNDGITRGEPVPLNYSENAYIQASYGGEVVQIGDLSAGLVAVPAGTRYVEIAGNLIDFHTGQATVANLDYDARILVTGVTAVNGGSNLSIYCQDFILNFSPTGALYINGSAGLAGQVLTSAGPNLPPVWV